MRTFFNLKKDLRMEFSMCNYLENLVYLFILIDYYKLPLNIQELCSLFWFILSWILNGNKNTAFKYKLEMSL